MLLMSSHETHLRTVFPPLKVELVGEITATGDGPPDCPVCGGHLDLCQPDADDGGASQLVGACVDCDRLSLVIGTGVVAVVMALPTVNELSSRAFSERFATA